MLFRRLWFILFFLYLFYFVYNHHFRFLYFNLILIYFLSKILFHLRLLNFFAHIICNLLLHIIFNWIDLLSHILYLLNIFTHFLDHFFIRFYCFDLFIHSISGVGFLFQNDFAWTILQFFHYIFLFFYLFGRNCRFIFYIKCFSCLMSIRINKSSSRISFKIYFLCYSVFRLLRIAYPYRLFKFI